MRSVKKTHLSSHNEKLVAKESIQKDNVRSRIRYKEHLIKILDQMTLEEMQAFIGDKTGMLLEKLENQKRTLEKVRDLPENLKAISNKRKLNESLRTKHRTSKTEKTSKLLEEMPQWPTKSISKEISYDEDSTDSEKSSSSDVESDSDSSSTEKD